jgi:hypothetical protein
MIDFISASHSQAIFTPEYKHTTLRCMCRVVSRLAVLLVEFSFSRGTRFLIDKKFSIGRK